MPTTTRNERHAWILEAQSLLAQGKSSPAVIKILVERDGIPQRTACRYVEAAWREWNLRRINQKRDHRMARALARIDKAADIAINGVRRIVVDGEVREFPEADPRALLDAVQVEAKLLGLNAPERREVMIATFDVMAAELIAAMQREIVDPLPPAAELRRRLARGLRVAMETAARAMKEPKNIETTTSLSSSSSSSSSSSKNSLCDTKSDPGTNGSTPGMNGSAPT